MKSAVCMIVFSYYPADPRVRREAEALIAAGYPVDVVCLRNQGQSARESFHDVEIFRVPLSKRRGGKLRYIWEYACFILLAFFRAASLWFRRRHRIVQVHNMPDVLVFSALIPRLFGARLILDLHDPMPEVFMTKYGIGAAHPMIRILRFLERLSIGFSSFVLTPNKSFRDLFVSRGCPPDKIEIVMNSPQENIFGSGESVSPPVPDRFHIMYHGTVVERHGLGTALRALAEIGDRIPGLKFHVYGEGDYVDPFLRLRQELDLEDTVEYHGHVSLEQIADAIRRADLGLIPNLRSVFTEINMPTRIFEYLSLGKSVIAPRTRGVQDYFADDEIYFFEPGDVASLRDAILQVHSDPEERQRRLEKGLAIFRAHRWELEREKLIGVVRRLAGPRSG